jgi:hypothetical protein
MSGIIKTNIIANFHSTWQHSFFRSSHHVVV